MAVLLKVADPSSSLFAVHRPNTGRQAHSEKLKVLQKKYTKVEEAEKWWNMQYQSSLSVCSHAFWSVSQSEAVSSCMYVQWKCLCMQYDEQLDKVS